MSTELTQVEQIASLPRDLAILKMENDSIQALAAARPLDYELIKRDLDAQLTAFPQLATEAIYNKPVGREDDKCGACGASPIFRDKKTKKKAAKCFTCGSNNIIEGPMKYARGLSIRAAETLAESIGFNRVAADSSFVDANTVKVSASFTNYRTGRIWDDSTMIRNTFTGRDGSQQVINDDRFLGLIVKAEKSRIIREVINRSIPAGLKAWFTERCEALVDEVLDDKTVEKIVGVFSTKGVKVEEIEALLGRTRAGWTKQDRSTLLGILNAVKDGETTIEEAFRGNEAPESESKVTTSAMNEKLQQEKDKAANGNGAKTEAAKDQAAEQKPDEPNGDSKDESATEEKKPETPPRSDTYRRFEAEINSAGMLSLLKKIKAAIQADKDISPLEQNDLLMLQNARHAELAKV